MTSSPDPAAEFRRDATWTFRFFVVFLVAVAAGVSYLGWRWGHWWGLVGGTAVGLVMLAGGLVVGTMMWAMTQDGR